MSSDLFIERKIIMNMITSDDFIRSIGEMWNPEYISSSTARLLASWCLEYHKRYNKAPGRDIEGIFLAKQKKLSEEQIADIDSILISLNEDWWEENTNVQYLSDQTKSYFIEKSLRLFSEEIRNYVDSGEITEAENVALGYTSVQAEENWEQRTIDPFSDLEKIRQAFEEQAEPLIKFPKALGRYWNNQMCRDSFVSLVGPEKRGKTFMLMEIAMRAMASGNNVVFFQAGDMSELQQLRRLCVYLAKRSDKERYCGERYIPVVDCWKSQTGICKKNCRENKNNQKVFEPGTNQKEITFDQILEAYKDNPGYSPCRNCPEGEENGAVWIKHSDKVSTLQWKEAYKKVRKWQRKHKKKFKLSTYPNETLSVQEINSLLDTWEKREGFVPDVIVIDYADILAPDPDCVKLDSRHQSNKIWQRLRKLSQTRHSLVVTATQAAATAYDKDSIRLKDFSEDKRKYAHVTAMYALNQTEEEKKLGILRLGELLLRDDEFDRGKQIKVLQCLQRGSPVIGSYF